MLNGKITAKDFIRSLHKNVEGGGYFFLRLSSNGKGHMIPFKYPDEVELISKFENRKDKDVYFFPALFKTGSTQKIDNLLAMSAIYIDIDNPPINFNLLPKTLLPSIIVSSGKGFHLYWILNEPLEAPDEIDTYIKISTALTNRLNGDRQAIKPNHGARLPNTYNLKYDQPQPVVITRFEPDQTFNPSDFDIIMPEKPEISTPKPPPAIQNTNNNTKKITEKQKKAGISILKQLYRNGKRHLFCLHLAGFLLKEGYSNQSVGTFITELATACKDNEINDRIQAIKDTIERYQRGENIKGWQGLLEMFPERTQRNKLYTFKDILSTTEFGIISIKKFTYDNPIYIVTVRLGDEKYQVNCTASELYSFTTFEKAFFKLHDKYLPPISKSHWRAIIEKADKQYENPSEGTLEQAIQEVLNQFTEHPLTPTDPDNPPLMAGGVLNSNGDICFRLDTLIKALRKKELDVEPSTKLVGIILKKLGYDARSIRFGSKVFRVWTKNIKIE